MKDYFQWYQDARQNITAGTNPWQDYDYLVFRCLEHDQKCGGAADRLQPVPFVLQVGSKLNRLVFYKWEVPAPLDESLVPPADGLDWRWPPHANLANYSFPPQLSLSRSTVSHLLGISNVGDVSTSKPKLDYTWRGAPQIATFRFQSTNHGRPEYNAMRISSSSNETEEASFTDIFRDCWNSVFVPSPPVQRQIDSVMAGFGIQRDEYHAIHIRSQYHQVLKRGKLEKQPPMWSIVCTTTCATNDSRPCKLLTLPFLWPRTVAQQLA
jgi:hypothetical protein